MSDTLNLESRTCIEELLPSFALSQQVRWPIVPQVRAGGARSGSKPHAPGIALRPKQVLGISESVSPQTGVSEPIRGEFLPLSPVRSRTTYRPRRKRSDETLALRVHMLI